MGTGQWLLSKPSWPFYPVPLTRYMALLFLYSRKESIEKIKNVASGEFKIRFLQNTKWKREENNRNREPHDLHKTYICGLGESGVAPGWEGIPGCLPGAGCTGSRERRRPPGLPQAGTLLLRLQRLPIPSLLVLLSFLRYICFHCINVV